MDIGPVRVQGTARLAPMAGISNAPFRVVAQSCGSGLTTSEEIDAVGLLRESRKTDKIASYLPGERPLVMQLLGADAESLAPAALLLEESGADIIDINMGCPMRKVTKKGKGSAMMKDVPRTARILAAIVKTVTVPLTIKIRGGWDERHINAVEVARMAQDEGVAAITVHPRTRSQVFNGKAPWDIIAEVVDAVDIPVTGNGDVRSMADARAMKKQTGCQSVMIGRGALGRPWVFDEEFESLDDDAQSAYKKRVIERHIDLMQEYFDDRYGHMQLKRQLSWYAGGRNGARSFRKRLFESQAADATLEIFWDYWRTASQAAGPAAIAPGARTIDAA